MRVAKINQTCDFSWLWPGVTDQHVVVVRIAVNYAVAQTRQVGNHFGFVQREKLFHQRAPLRIGNVLDMVFDPSRARRIPLEFAMRRGMIERLQRRVHFAQKLAKIAKQLVRMRANLRQNRSIHEAEQPDEPRRAVCRRHRRRKQFSLPIWDNAGQW